MNAVFPYLPGTAAGDARDTPVLRAFPSPLPGLDVFCNAYRWFSYRFTTG